MKRVIDKNQDEFLTQDGQWWWVPLKEQSSVKKVGPFKSKEKARADAHDNCWVPE
jgi:hypothetical protein